MIQTRSNFSHYCILTVLVSWKWRGLLVHKTYGATSSAANLAEVWLESSTDASKWRNQWWHTAKKGLTSKWRSVTDVSSVWFCHICPSGCFKLECNTTGNYKLACQQEKKAKRSWSHYGIEATPFSPQLASLVQDIGKLHECCYWPRLLNNIQTRVKCLCIKLICKKLWNKYACGRKSVAFFLALFYAATWS